MVTVSDPSSPEGSFVPDSVSVPPVPIVSESPEPISTPATVSGARRLETALGAVMQAYVVEPGTPAVQLPDVVHARSTPAPVQESAPEGQESTTGFATVRWRRARVRSTRRETVVPGGTTTVWSVGVYPGRRTSKR